MDQSSPKNRLLLIGWDAADWKFINPLLDAGLMPNLSRIVDGGVMGNLASLRPCLSPILWTSIATGKTADKHGIAGFVEPVPGGGGVRLSSSTSRKTKAIWNILSQSAVQCVVVNWYASHPSEPIRGTCISNRFFEGLPRDPNEPWQVIPGSVHPHTLAPTISGFRMHPAEFARNDLERFIPRIDDIDLVSDTRPSQLAEILAKTISVHSIATGAMEAEPWDFLAVYYDGLDVAGHEFMPFHPPRLASVSESDFELYQHVMRELYLFHDEMLGKLLELAGEQTTVILLSDHGFHCDQLRPYHGNTDVASEEQAAKWHRPYGILAMMGPKLLQDERVYGATLLDIAPTILAHFGLPVGQDMDGKTLTQAFSPPGIVVTSIPSWDLLSGVDGMHPANTQQAMMSSPLIVSQLVALGYLPAETTESAKSVAIATAESQFNLAIVHGSHSRPYEAQLIFEQLCELDPQNSRYALALARTLADQGLHDKAITLVKALEASGHRSLECELLFAAEFFNVGKSVDALERLLRVESSYPSSPSLFRVIGDIHLQQESWQMAREAFGKCLLLDEDDPHAHNGMARAAIKLREFELGGEHALRAISLLYFFPRAHFHMGLALKEMGEVTRAIRSFHLAVTQSPGFQEAHAELASLYDRSNEWQLWSKHHRLANGLPPC